MRAFLRSVSPLTAASGIHRPVLIIQGSSNRDVPPQESDQLLARLRRSPRGSTAREAICEILVRRYAALVRSCVRPYRLSP